MTAFTACALCLVVVWGIAEIYFTERNKGIALDWLDLIADMRAEASPDLRTLYAVDCYGAIYFWRYKDFIADPYRVIHVIEREREMGNRAASSKRISRLYRAAKRMAGEL